MKKVLKYLIPLLGLLGLEFISRMIPYWMLSLVGFEGFFNVRENWAHSRLFLSLLIFCVAYFLTDLTIKNKKNVVWFIVPCVVYTIFPLFFGMKIAYLLLSFANFIQFSLYAAIFYLAINWREKNKRAKELEKQNLQSELAMLKNQINPHFLFNTLNNIDSLIKSNPDHASQSLIELSDMMRYMLYETNVDRVPLQKELDYINDYLKLQKLQYANVHLVDYSISGNTEKIERITVAPMLFIPFIENAFKHCTDKEKEHAIQFSMVIERGHIRFRANNISDSNHVISKDSSSGIGLETVKRRLEILYPGKHSLQINEKNNLFCVELNIDIDD